MERCPAVVSDAAAPRTLAGDRASLTENSLVRTGDIGSNISLPEPLPIGRIGRSTRETRPNQHKGFAYGQTLPSAIMLDADGTASARTPVATGTRGLQQSWSPTGSFSDPAGDAAAAMFRPFDGNACADRPGPVIHEMQTHAGGVGRLGKADAIIGYAEDMRSGHGC